MVNRKWKVSGRKWLIALIWGAMTYVLVLLTVRPSGTMWLAEALGISIFTWGLPALSLWLTWRKKTEIGLRDLALPVVAWAVLFFAISR